MSSGGGDVRNVALTARRENFPVASRLLPREHRRHLLAVYGFARFVDDIGDEAAPAERPHLLDTVEADLDRLYTGRVPRLPVTRVLAPTVGACSVPAEPFHRLVKANRHDQTVTRYGTFADLLAYCDLSANPVGHIVLHIFGAASPMRLALSDRVCSALQILEHCQDVGEDYARGRVYLPGEDLRHFGCAERDLAGGAAGRTAGTGVLAAAPMGGAPDGLAGGSAGGAAGGLAAGLAGGAESVLGGGAMGGSTPARVRRVVAVQVTRARRLLHEGGPLVASLTGFPRIAVAGYVAGGLATVAALEREGYDVLGRAVRPRRTGLLSAWLRVLARQR
ncbi:squalene/phytoene synthase family protein [Planotetraspora sp. A-T 1434]|uniref:squalene/phytoene synthase family protein n=1 Tax=Planotetraspora sp. A-T 1434 TaxID=2979219 RepID=UPI0021C02407|nr:squalene/phytoene synthase family protein [Planotetraspora sp. A-T 1434]MCT9934265.1 squalene/phytoene synthase family protein [Planotetraspora sp. A-T 1434]